MSRVETIHIENRRKIKDIILKFPELMESNAKEIIEKDKSTINEVIDNLSESDKELLRLRYGNDLENPVTSCDFDTNASSRFYQTIKDA